MMATRDCPKCDGTGFRPVLGPLHVRCHACNGTGQQIRLSARIWSLIRHGAREGY